MFELHVTGVGKICVLCSHLDFSVDRPKDFMVNNKTTDRPIISRAPMPMITVMVDRKTSPPSELHRL